jgi:hypothetical protein
MTTFDMMPALCPPGLPRGNGIRVVTVHSILRLLGISSELGIDDRVGADLDERCGPDQRRHPDLRTASGPCRRGDG